MAARSQISVSNGLTLPKRDALYLSDTEKTFAKDESLPSLPVPTLDQTIQKYLDSVKVLVTDEEFQHTVKIAENFKNGIGKELHLKLLEKAKNQKNWLEKWWEDVAYLSQRTPLLPLCSMAGVTHMDDVWLPKAGTQIEHAALYMHFILQFWKALRKEQVRPHNSHGVPWSMHQFRRYFNTVRIPGEVIDKIECHFHTEAEESTIPTHFVVLHCGHIFTFDAVDEFGEILTPPELYLQFQRIKEWCNMNGWGDSVAALTVDDRTTWAKNREWLLQIHPENELHMETINTSMIAVVLDDAEPTSLSEVVKNNFAGNPANRWADKSIASIFYKNGQIGNVCDHTPYDGLVPVVIGHFGYASVRECGGVWKGPQTVDRDLLPPRRLDFHLDDHIRAAIQEAKKVYAMMADDTDVTCTCFTEYGKSFLKPYNVHPESYFQFALHLAYYTMHGSPVPAYVTAATRQFYHGRTETLRSCCVEILDWVHAMSDDQTTASERLYLMKIAADKMKQLMKDCMLNHGCDRHLLGLYMISVEEEMPLPELYTDTSFVKSGGNGNFVLSTSCCGYTSIGGCVMPMREDGYGVFYNIENNRFMITISAFNRCPETSAAKLYEHVEKALLNMQQLLLSAKL